MTGYVVVMITASGEEEAAAAAHALVSERLAACVNIIRGVRSVYRWRGKVEDEAEVILIAKTRAGLVSDLAKKVKEIHSYTVPEVIALPILDGSEDYLKWLGDETREGI